jgi:hypothetical protein
VHFRPPQLASIVLSYERASQFVLAMSPASLAAFQYTRFWFRCWHRSWSGAAYCFVALVVPLILSGMIQKRPSGALAGALACSALALIRPATQFKFGALQPDG